AQAGKARACGSRGAVTGPPLVADATNCWVSLPSCGEPVAMSLPGSGRLCLLEGSAGAGHERRSVRGGAVRRACRTVSRGVQGLQQRFEMGTVALPATDRLREQRLAHLQRAGGPHRPAILEERQTARVPLQPAVGEQLARDALLILHQGLIVY